MIANDKQASTNPYAPPKSPVGEATTSRFYSPWQICVGAILGGPLAAGYLYSRDHILFGSPNKARTSLLWTGVVLLCLFAVALSLPKHSSGTILAAAVAGMYRWFARQAFDETISMRRNQGWTSYSWWRVVGLSIVGLTLTLGILLVLVLLLPERWTANL
jgi:ABC-type Mn2+/Zn2+ transport system permease subunit